MKPTKQILFIAVFALLAVPSLASAAWWNPTSWFKKSANPTPPKVVQVQVGTTTPTANSVPLPISAKEKSAKKISTSPHTSVVSNENPQPKKTAPTASENNQVAAQELQRQQRLAQQKAEQEKQQKDYLQQQQVQQATAEAQARAYQEQQQAQLQVQQQALPVNTIFCNGINWNRCPSGQNFVCPSTGSAYCENPRQQQDAFQQAQAQAYQEQQRQQQLQQQAQQEEYARQANAQKLKQDQINQLISEYQQRQNEILQRYYQDVAGVEHQAIPIQFINGQKNRLLDEANSKLAQLKLDYQQKIQAIQ